MHAYIVASNMWTIKLTFDSDCGFGAINTRGYPPQTAHMGHMGRMHVDHREGFIGKMPYPLCLAIHTPLPLAGGSQPNTLISPFQGWGGVAFPLKP